METGQYLYPTDNGYEFLEQNLMRIYGWRGNFAENISRYINSDHYRGGYRKVKNVDEIPELSLEQIRNLIAREENFKKCSAQICEQFDEILRQKKEPTDADYEAIAGIMGLAPGQCKREDTLFPNLLNLYVRSEEEASEIFDAVKKNKRTLQMIVSCMLDGMRSGQIIRFGNREVFSQGYVRNYFRGENAYNATCKASMYRGRSEDTSQAAVDDFVGYMRILEFTRWLDGLRCVRQWPYGSVHGFALAQHYGIHTPLIDVTSDIRVALFFACCRYDEKQGKWCPLKKSEFEFADSRPKIAGRGGDSRYGILYCAPADVENMCRHAHHTANGRTLIEPIGYQPFMRCPKQSGYYLIACSAYDMYQDLAFAKVKFRHSEELCQWIYKEMDEGKKVYPNEGKRNGSPIAELIAKTKQFTWQVFLDTAKHLAKSAEETSLLEQRLRNDGYTFAEDIKWCSDEAQEEMDAAWAKFDYEKVNQVSPVLRPGFSI